MSKESIKSKEDLVSYLNEKMKRMRDEETYLSSNLFGCVLWWFFWWFHFPAQRSENRMVLIQRMFENHFYENSLMKCKRWYWIFLCESVAHKKMLTCMKASKSTSYKCIYVSTFLHLKAWKFFYSGTIKSLAFIEKQSLNSHLCTSGSIVNNSFACILTLNFHFFFFT